VEKEKSENPLQRIYVTPLASESFGVRSLCTLVQTSDVVVLLDAGVALAPYRFSLPPHPIEFQTIQRLRQVIAEASNKASVTTISHYHYDHHTPSFEDWVVNWTSGSETARQIYKDKIVLAKNPKENINTSQRERAWMFQKTAAKHAKIFKAADGKSFSFGDTEVAFSEAVAHGSDDHQIGWVIMCTITHEGERFMFAPDVQGPISLHTTELMLASKPDVLMLGGPPTYLEAIRVDEHKIRQALLNLERIVAAVPTVIVEHHALRDGMWRQKLEPVFRRADEVGHRVLTAAEYAGKENLFLESKRKQLYKEQPPSEEFMQWTKTLTGKHIARPPI
jgi:predicted metallo-beta-lactamase superfamily hydrolase